MARFCTKCGKPLEEGEVCSCTQQAAPEAAAQTQQFQQTQQQTAQQAGYMSNEQQFQQTQQAVAGFLTRVGGAFLNIVKHPVSHGRIMIQTADYQVGIALIVLQGICTAIFGAVAASKLAGLINTLIGGVMSYLGGYGDDLELPYAKIIFGTMLISIGLSFLLALLLMLGNMAVKNALNYKQMIGAVASRSCVVVIATVLAILLYLLNPIAGLTIFAMGNIWGFFIILLAMPLADEAMKDKLPLVMILVWLVFTIALGLCIRYGSQLYVPDMGDLSDLSSIFS